jgi:hypothetical protein
VITCPPPAFTNEWGYIPEFIGEIAAGDSSIMAKVTALYHHHHHQAIRNSIPTGKKNSLIDLKRKGTKNPSS